MTQGTDIELTIACQCSDCLFHKAEHCGLRNSAVEFMSSGECLSYSSLQMGLQRLLQDEPVELLPRLVPDRPEPDYQTNRCAARECLHHDGEYWCSLSTDEREVDENGVCDAFDDTSPYSIANIERMEVQLYELERQQLAVRPCPLEACTHNARASCTLPAHQVRIDERGTCWAFQPRGSAMISTPQPRGSAMISTPQPPAVPLHEEPEPGCILTSLVLLRYFIGLLQAVAIGVAVLVSFWSGVEWFVLLSVVQIVIMGLSMLIMRSRKMI